MKYVKNNAWQTISRLQGQDDNGGSEGIMSDLSINGI